MCSSCMPSVKDIFTAKLLLLDCFIEACITCLLFICPVKSSEIVKIFLVICVTMKF